MSGFSVDWLNLREPADRAARHPAMTEAAAAWLRGRAGAGLVVDIGCGTGASLRALAPLAPTARWRLIDHDPALLSHAAACAAALGVAAETVAADLAADLSAVFRPAPDLVTASAFFDLAGAAWIDGFAERLAATGAALYAPLIYEGEEVWQPPHPADGAVHRAFAEDMRREKGLGRALGPAAGAYLAERLRALGHVVTTAPSPWRLEAPADKALIAALAEGKASAAHASGAWLSARRASTRVVIGHVDLLALPTA